MQQPNPTNNMYQTPMPPDGRHRRHGRFGRFFRGYLMTVGALTTAYGLMRLIVLLLLEISKWV